MGVENRFGWWANSLLGNELLYGFVLTIVVISQTVSRAIQVILVSGGAEIRGDARLVWIPVARAVLNGTPLYTKEAVDNKPPLWHYFNLLFEISGSYILTGLIVIGIANIIVVLGTYY